MKHFAALIVISFALSVIVVARAVAVDVIVAEGERFKALDSKGWTVIAQDDSYASHTYGGMWLTNGACLGAPALSVDSTAVQTVTISTDGNYRVWSKYQSPPYYNYLHKIEIVQNGKTVFSHVYGSIKTDKLWSFSASGKQIWWPWGVDHDAAEAPSEMVNLVAGKADIRLVTVPNVNPAGNRYVDFVLLTTNPDNNYEGYPKQIGTPFVNEALGASKLYMRFLNPTKSASKLKVEKKVGHFQPNYGSSSSEFPENPVDPGKWSAWFNIAPFCRFVHDEGLWLTVPDAENIRVQVARRADGKDLVGDVKVVNGEAIVIPIGIAWRKGAKVSTSRLEQEKIIAASRTWPKANGGKKPKQTLFFAHFPLPEMRDALGYNTGLPEKYDQVARTDIAYHHGITEADIRKLADAKNKANIGIVSFGDEISLGSIDYADPKIQALYREWLKSKGVTSSDLGVDPDKSELTRTGSPREVWYSTLFEENQLFASFRHLTDVAEEVLGKGVLTGANFAPHHLALYYGPIFQWVDLFKNNGMSMFWAEDYIYSVPEAPQIISWQLAEMRCAVKYNNQPIHFYVMPHSPGQQPAFLRRNTLLAVGSGVKQIDNFVVAPMEGSTENYVSWRYPEMFRAIHDCIYESAEAESILATAKLRPAKVAVIISKATDFNESRLNIDASNDPLASTCDNVPKKITQTLCRKDQQYLYLALRNAGHAVDLITEDDIAEDGALSSYQVVYFAGEWIDSRAVSKLDAWVKTGGILYAAAGAGYLNQFGEPNPAMLALLGLKSTNVQKNAVVMRTFVELPLAPEIDAIRASDGSKIPVVGMRQELVPDTATILGTWGDGSAAVTVHSYDRGKVFTVGTLAGAAWMRSSLKTQPWARGGHKAAWNPTDFSDTGKWLVMHGALAANIDKQAQASAPSIETAVADGENGTVVTLVNWGNDPLRDLKVEVRMPQAPRDVRSVGAQKSLKWSYADGILTFNTRLNDADYILLRK